MKKTVRRLTAKEIARIKTLSKAGKSERQIAKVIGCSRSSVWYHLQ